MSLLNRHCYNNLDNSGVASVDSLPHGLGDATAEFLYLLSTLGTSGFNSFHQIRSLLLLSSCDGDSTVWLMRPVGWVTSTSDPHA